MLHQLSQGLNMVEHEKLIVIFKTTGIDHENIRIIAELYWNQVAEIKVEKSLAQEVR